MGVLGGGGTHILTSSGWPYLREPLLFSQAATRGHTNPGVLHSRARGWDVGRGRDWRVLLWLPGPLSPSHSPGGLLDDAGKAEWASGSWKFQCCPFPPGEECTHTHTHTHSLSSSSRSSFSSFMRKLMEYTFLYRFFCIWNSLLGDSCRHSLQEGPPSSVWDPESWRNPASYRLCPRLQGLPSTDSVRPLPFPSSRRPGMTLSPRQAMAARPLLSGVAE